MSSTIYYAGKKIDLDAAFITPKLIMQHAREDLAKNRKVAFRQKGSSELTPLDQVPEDRDLGTEVQVKTYPAGTIKGMSTRREQYIKAHVASVAEVYGQRYGQALQLDKHFRFVFLPRFTLPRKWGMRTTPLLIWFPQSYPETPPNGFYLSSKCKGPHVFSRNVYGDSPDLSNKGWNWFCVHSEKGWHPHEDPTKEDNLWTFLDVIKLSLSISEF